MFICCCIFFTLILVRFKIQMSKKYFVKNKTYSFKMFYVLKSNNITQQSTLIRLELEFEFGILFYYLNMVLISILFHSLSLSLSLFHQILHITSYHIKSTSPLNQPSFVQTSMNHNVLNIIEYFLYILPICCPCYLLSYIVQS